MDRKLGDRRLAWARNAVAAAAQGIGRCGHRLETHQVLGGRREDLRRRETVFEVHLDPAAAALAGSAAPSATPAPADASASSVHVQSRTSVSAAISGGDPRNIAQALAATYTWTGDQWTCLDKLWNHESKYETTVRNPSSGAYGIPQALPASKMGSVGADWRTNPVTQIVWGLGYIQDRYGSPCGAWSYWLRHNSY